MFTRQIRDFAALPGTPYANPLLEAVQRLEDVSDWLRAQATLNPNEIGAASVEYLHLFGYVAYAWLWARMADVAQRAREAEPAFYDAKLATASFYFSRVLPRTLSLEQTIRAGSNSLFELDAASF